MSRRERPAGAGLGSAVPSHPQAALGEPVADSADVFLFAGSPAVGLKASSSPGALSAPSPEGAPRGVLGTSADDTVWISAMGAFRGVGQIVSGGTGSGSVGGLGSGGGSGSGPGIGGVGEGGSGVWFGMGRVCPHRLLGKRGRRLLAWPRWTWQLDETNFQDVLGVYPNPLNGLDPRRLLSLSPPIDLGLSVAFARLDMALLACRQAQLDKGAHATNHIARPWRSLPPGVR